MLSQGLLSVGPSWSPRHQIKSVNVSVITPRHTLHCKQQSWWYIYQVSWRYVYLYCPRKIIYGRVNGRVVVGRHRNIWDDVQSLNIRRPTLSLTRNLRLRQRLSSYTPSLCWKAFQLLIITKLHRRLHITSAWTQACA